MYAGLARLLRPVAEVAANTMALNLAVGSSDTAWEAGGGLVDPGTMTTVPEFLEKKARLPARARS